MALTKIYIKGNFLIAEDFISRDVFFKMNVKNVLHLRSSIDDFAFFDSKPFKGLNGTEFLQLGKMQDWNFTAQHLDPQSDVLSRTYFEYINIVDVNGVPYLSANDFNDFLDDELGKSCDGGGGLTHVDTDATLTGDGTPGNPLSVVGVQGSLLTKSGLADVSVFAGVPIKVATVVFATPFPNTNYSIVVNPNTQNNTTFNVDHEQKTATGFVINTHANNLTNLLEVSWIAIQNGESI